MLKQLLKQGRGAEAEKMDPREFLDAMSKAGAVERDHSSTSAVDARWMTNNSPTSRSEINMQNVLTMIASSSNPRNALAVLRRLAVIAPDENRFARAEAAAKELAQQMDPKDIVDSEANSYDKDHIDWYIGDAMARLVEGEADEVKRAQYRDIKDAFAAFYDDDGSGDPWRLMATLDFAEISPEEFNEAKRITDRLGSMLPDLRSLLGDARRLTDKSPAARDVLAPMLFFLSNTTEEAVEAHELSQCRLRPAWADLRDLPDSADHLRAQAPSMRGG